MEEIWARHPRWIYVRLGISCNLHCLEINVISFVCIKIINNKILVTFKERRVLLEICTKISAIMQNDRRNRSTEVMFTIKIFTRNDIPEIYTQYKLFCF